MKGRARLGPRYHPVSPPVRSAHEVRVHTSAIYNGRQPRHRLLGLDASPLGVQLGRDLRLDLSRPPFTSLRALWSDPFEAALSPSAPCRLLYRSDHSSAIARTSRPGPPNFPAGRGVLSAQYEGVVRRPTVSFRDRPWACGPPTPRNMRPSVCHAEPGARHLSASTPPVCACPALVFRRAQPVSFRAHARNLPGILGQVHRGSHAVLPTGPSPRADAPPAP